MLNKKVGEDKESACQKTPPFWRGLFSKIYSHWEEWWLNQPPF